MYGNDTHAAANHTATASLDEKTDRTIAQHELRSLLAVIHGDGGHYADEHGLEKATEDAQAKWYARGTQLDCYRDALEATAALAVTMFNMLDYTPGVVGTELRGLYERAMSLRRAALDPEAA